MKITDAMFRVIGYLYYETLDGYGEVDKRVSLSRVHANTVRSLKRHGLIDWKGESIYGSGYALTLAGKNWYDANALVDAADK